MDYSMQVEFSEQDRMILRHYFVVADAIALAVGKHCEVVIHSLEDLNHSVVKLVNGYISGRSVGAPITNIYFKILKDIDKTHEDFIGPYCTKGINGHTIRSITSIIRGAAGNPIGLMCMNMDLSVPFSDLMKEYAEESSKHDDAGYEIYPNTVDDLIHHMLSEAIKAANETKGLTQPERNTLTVQILMDKGIFTFKGAVDVVANEMGISRTSVYNYMRLQRC